MVLHKGVILKPLYMLIIRRPGRNHFNCIDIDGKVKCICQEMAAHERQNINYFLLAFVSRGGNTAINQA